MAARKPLVMASGSIQQLQSGDTVDLSALAWQACPEDYGAVGDGVADDTVAMKAAFATGKAVVLSPGATYLITQPLRLTDGQSLVGHRATLKRGPQYSTTTTDTITDAVTTTLTVADASDLKADDWVFLAQGSTYSPTLRRILSIAGNVLTFSSALSGNWSGTTTVWTAWTFITAEDGYCRIIDVRFDGQKAGWSYNRWEILSEIAITGEQSLVQGCEFVDSPGEAIVCYGDYHLIKHCRGTDLNGNGIHWSGGSHSTADTCTFINTNLDVDLGHQEGCITWSILCDNVTVSNCWLENGITGLGGMADPTDSQIRVIGNTIVNPQTYGLDFNCGSTTSAVNQSSIIGNRFVGGQWGISATNSQTPASADGFLKGLVIQGNNFSGQSVGALELTRLADSDISGNTIDNRSASGDQILVIGCDSVSISTNAVHGGASGVRLGSGSTRVAVTSNVLRGQSAFGVAYDSSVGEGNEVQSNTILNEEATSANGYIGINCSHRIVAFDNHITLTNNGGALTAVRGIQVSSSPYSTTTLGPGAVCSRNTVVGNAQYGIRLDGGTGKAIVTDNHVTATTIISNAGGTHNGQSAAGSYTGTITAGALQTGAYITISNGGNGYVGTTVLILLKQAGMNTPGDYALATGTVVNGVVASAAITSGGSSFVTGEPVTLHFGGNYVAHNALLGTGANEDPLAATPILQNYSIQSGTPVTLTVGASIGINAALGTEATIAIAQNTTITMTGARLGRKFDLHIYTTGVYTVTFSTGTSGVQTFTTVPNKFHHVHLWSNGSVFWEAIPRTPEQIRTYLASDLVQSHVAGTYQTILSVSLPVGIHNWKSIVPHTRGAGSAVYNRLIAGTATLAGAVGDGLGFGLVEGSVASLVTVAATGTWTTSAPVRSSAANGACHTLDVTFEVLTAGTVLLQGNLNTTANMTWKRGSSVVVTQIA
jgi:Right handed beta helix region